MEGTIQELKSTVSQYRDLDAKLNDVNRQAASIRNEKKTLESTLSRILSQPEFKDVKTLQIQEDGSQLQIQRPNAWNKSWHLSKKDLEETIYKYFDNTPHPNAIECVQYILENQKEKLVSKEFAFNLTSSKR